jgi:hypothetical protein
MRIRPAPSLAVILGICSACATVRPTGGPDSPVQLQVPAALAWEPGGPFDIRLVIANGTSMTFWIAQPKAEASDVTVYQPDGAIACKTPAAVEKVYERWAGSQLAPGKPYELHRDLRKDCPPLRPGVYRYEANYRANSVEGFPSSLYRATLGPQEGRILVREGATGMTPAEVEAAVWPAQTTVPSAPEPAETAMPSPAAEPGASASPAGIRACVDRELRDRGLNAYGDPPGTKYDGGLPAEESGRILYVGARNEAIRRACKLPAL